MIKWQLVLDFALTILIPLLYLYNILITVFTKNSFELNIQLQVTGIFVAIFGLIIWIMSLVNLGESFGVLPQKQKKIKKGLYKYINHPMYIGIWCTFLGLAISCGSWQGLVFLNLIMTPLLFIRAYFEDKKLYS